MYYYRCDRCGKFISTKDEKAITYTNWGHDYDTCPPDPTYICGRCVKPKDWNIDAWYKPSKLNQSTGGTR